jgi:hypothetical protein
MYSRPMTGVKYTRRGLLLFGIEYNTDWGKREGGQGRRRGRTDRTCRMFFFLLDRIDRIR